MEKIRLKSENDIEYLKKSGKILANILNILKKETREGVSLSFLDKLAYDLIIKADSKPAFLGYKSEGSKKSYPASICTSLNSQIVHGLPSGYVLKNGDVLKIDLGVNYKGYFTDAAITVGIGEISKNAKKLIATTEKALNSGIKECKPGNSLGDIGFAIEKLTHERGFFVIKGLTGHGTGFELHEDPTVYNYGKKKEGLKLVPGLVLAIEPMLSSGSSDIVQLKDDSFATKDGSLSAHFEHSVLVTHNSPIILTKL